MSTHVTLGGRLWTPRYVVSIDQERCIGCGRCYKACGRAVLGVVEKPFAGDDDEYGDRMGNQVMSVQDRADCIGCEACARACAKKCHTHAPAA